MNKIVTFFKEVKAELWKVVWPSRRDAIRYTITVIVFSLVVAAILGAADFGLLKGFEALIKDSPIPTQTTTTESEAEIINFGELEESDNTESSVTE